MARKINISTNLSTTRHPMILEFIGQFCKENKYCPSIREVADVIKSSTSVARFYIDQLKVKGLVDYVKREARTLHLTEEGELAIAHPVKLVARAKVKA